MYIGTICENKNTKRGRIQWKGGATRLPLLLAPFGFPFAHRNPILPRLNRPAGPPPAAMFSKLFRVCRDDSHSSSSEKLKQVFPLSLSLSHTHTHTHTHTQTHREKATTRLPSKIKEAIADYKQSEDHQVKSDISDFS
ncbi:hypothetical protein BHM03_00009987 [Ensete ventricosum]|nr:hypothetical protein BHM03_00009987 [Ensete ventricosum]